MDEELRQYFEAMEGRLEAMEGRLMRRINDNHATLFIEIRNLRSEHDVTRNMVSSLPATVLGAIEKPLLNRMTRLEEDIRKLKLKDEEGEH